MESTAKPLLPTSEWSAAADEANASRGAAAASAALPAAVATTSASSASQPVTIAAHAAWALLGCLQRERLANQGDRLPWPVLHAGHEHGIRACLAVEFTHRDREAAESGGARLRLAVLSVRLPQPADPGDSLLMERL